MQPEIETYDAIINHDFELPLSLLPLLLISKLRRWTAYRPSDYDPPRPAPPHHLNIFFGELSTNHPRSLEHQPPK